MKLTILLLSLIPFVIFSQEKKSSVNESMNQSLANACSCGEAILKKIEKRKSKGKKIFFNPSEEAHNCAQSALNEYWFIMYDQVDAFPHSQEALQKHKLLENEFNRRVYSECEALQTLHKMKK